MEVKSLPKSLKEITLEKYIGWYAEFGSLLLKVGRRKGKTPDEEAAFQLSFMLKHYAWYSGTPFNTVQDMAGEGEDTVIAIIKEASISQAQLFEELCSIEYADFNTAQFEFKGGLFKIEAPVMITDAAKVTVAQFEMCQNLALIFSDLQDEKFEALYELCAYYLQPVDTDSIGTAFWVCATADERINMVKSLPLQIAMCVKAYVTTTINLYKNLRHDRTAATD